MSCKENASKALSSEENAKTSEQNAKTLVDSMYDKLESGYFKGDKGEKGDPGESGIVTPLSGYISLSVDKDGNLWVYTADDKEVCPFEYDDTSGNLYYVTEE